MATFHLSDSHLGDITMKIIPELQLHPLTIHPKKKNRHPWGSRSWRFQSVALISKGKFCECIILGIPIHNELKLLFRKIFLFFNGNII